MIYIENHRCKEETIAKKFPGAIVLDLTSKSDYAKKLSPFYPHGGIPVSFSPGVTSECVEGVWQGLKVFRGEGPDPTRFRNDTMKGLKRTVRMLGPCLGHCRGLDGDPNKLLSYIEARKEIYVPTYLWMLEHCADAKALITRIGEEAEKADMVFLDYNTNEDINDCSSPLSHASLVKHYIEKHYPLSCEPHGAAPVIKKRREVKVTEQPLQFKD